MAAERVEAARYQAIEYHFHRGRAGACRYWIGRDYRAAIIRWNGRLRAAGRAGHATRRHLQPGQTSLRNLYWKRPAGFPGNRFATKYAAGSRTSAATERRAREGVRERSEKALRIGRGNASGPR